MLWTFCHLGQADNEMVQQTTAKTPSNYPLTMFALLKAMIQLDPDHDWFGFIERSLDRLLSPA